MEENEKHYFCYFCNIFFCSECVNSRKENKGFETLIHKEHYLIAFQNPDPNNLKNIEKYKLGKNLFAIKSEDELKRDHNFGCDCCAKADYYEERYICLTCEKGALMSNGLKDYCALCIKKIYDENQVNLLPEDDNHKENHVYLHMIYSGEDYYEY